MREREPAPHPPDEAALAPCPVELVAVAVHGQRALDDILGARPDLVDRFGHLEVAGDLDGNGRAELIIDFGDPYGLWVWNNGTWSQLHGVSPDSMITADLDGNGRDDLIVDFGNQYGIWVLMNNTAWSLLHWLSP